MQDDALYRITASDFLTGGGDGFTSFADGTDKVNGMSDIEALERYIAAQQRLVPPTPGRIINANSPSSPTP